MTVAFRLFGDRNLAASYRGEGRRLLFHLKNMAEPLEQEQGQIRRTYPDGTEIIVQKTPGQDFITINSPPVEVPVAEQEEPLGELIVFYSKDDEVNRVAVTSKAVFEGDAPDLDEWLATKWKMTFPKANLQIFGKQFTYKSHDVWYYRFPFSLKSPDPETEKGSYLFSGFSTGGSLNDYLYVEKTAKWYPIKSGTSVFDPFNVGDYLYLFSDGQCYAFDFNFETETMTTAKSVTPVGVTYATHIDTAGKIHYSKNSLVFFDWDPGYPADYGRGHDGIQGPGGQLAYYLGWEMGWTESVPIDLFILFNETMREFGCWPGLAFMDPYFPAWRNLDVNLYSYASWDMWAEAESVVNAPAYATSLYPLSYPAGAVGRGYQQYRHYPLSYACLGATAIEGQFLREEKIIWCAGEGYPFEASLVTTEELIEPDNGQYTGVKTLNHKYGEFRTLAWGQASINTDLGLTFAGSSTAVTTTKAGLISFTMSASAAYAGHYTDFSHITFLAFPLGNSPFGTYTIHERRRNVNVSGSMGGGASVSDDNPDVNGGVHMPAEWLYERRLFTPYGSKTLTEAETVTPWGFIDGEEFLLQSLKTSVTYGNILWADGDENAIDNLCRHLETTRDRIYGVMLCPNISEADESYLEGYAEE